MQEDRSEAEQQLALASREALEKQSMDAQEGSLEDELMPRPAFHIQEDNENLTEEERLAFSYILSVRSQKQSLIQSRKKQRLQASLVQIELEQKDQLTIRRDEVKNENEIVWASLKSWRLQLMSNWRCVIANMQYLHKRKQSQQLFHKKLGLESLFQMPEVNKICHNKWLALPQIEGLLVFLSNTKYQALQHHIQQQLEMPASDNFHIWMYSLLGLHQSYASYSNFQALASVNACLLKEGDYFQHQVKQGRAVAQVTIIQWLVTLVILIDGFNQSFLLGRVGLAKMFK